MPNYACHKHHLRWFVAHHLTKASYKISASFPDDVWAKVEKVQKNGQIMHNYAN